MEYNMREMNHEACFFPTVNSLDEKKVFYLRYETADSWWEGV